MKGRQEKTTPDHNALPSGGSELALCVLESPVLQDGHQVCRLHGQRELRELCVREGRLPGQRVDWKA